MSRGDGTLSPRLATVSRTCGGGDTHDTRRALLPLRRAPLGLRAARAALRRLSNRDVLTACVCLSDTDSVWTVRAPARDSVRAVVLHMTHNLCQNKSSAPCSQFSTQNNVCLVCDVRINNLAPGDPAKPGLPFITRCTRICGTGGQRQARTSHRPAREHLRSSQHSK